MILHKKFQKLGMIFWKNAQALNKATQGGFFFQKQLKPMGYYSGEKSRREIAQSRKNQEGISILKQKSTYCVDL